MRGRFVACPNCEGRGTQVNPAIDGNGITGDEMLELGEDFRQDYMSGVYDIPCLECHGERVVPACPKCGEPVAEGTYYSLHEPDDPDDEIIEIKRPYSACYEHLPQEEREWLDSERDTQAIYEAERRMGA